MAGNSGKARGLGAAAGGSGKASGLGAAAGKNHGK